MRTRRRRRSLAEINVVPYIDVMLVLLVIFMITAPLLTQGVNVNMPQAAAKAIKRTPQTPLIVTVDKAGNFYLNTQIHPDLPLDATAMTTQVAAELARAKEKKLLKPVLVKGDREVNYGAVISAMVILQQLGVEEIGLLTQAPQVTLKVTE